MREKIEAIVRECGETLLSAHDIAQGVTEKEGAANFVTKYDVMMQDMLRERLLALAPGATFYGEEGDDHGRGDSGGDEIIFIVDPIDGTMNFINHHPCCTISVGVAKNDRLICGVVYCPFLRELFSAEEGKGAYLNGERIHVNDKPFDKSVVCFGTASYYPELIDRSFALAKALFCHTADLRRSGSAALDLCDVACGRCDLFFELRLWPWDFAAGAVILREAGGVITTDDWEGTLPLFAPSGIFAGSESAHRGFYAAATEKKYTLPNFRD